MSTAQNVLQARRGWQAEERERREGKREKRGKGKGEERRREGEERENGGRREGLLQEEEERQPLETPITTLAHHDREWLTVEDVSVYTLYYDSPNNNRKSHGRGGIPYRYLTRHIYAAGNVHICMVHSDI